MEQLHGSVLEVCLSFLHLREVCLASVVSRTWYKAADSALVWNSLTSSFSPYFNREKVDTQVYLPLPRKDGLTWYFEDAKLKAYKKSLQQPQHEVHSSRWYFTSIFKWISGRLTNAMTALFPHLRPLPKRRYFEEKPNQWLPSTLCRKHFPTTCLFSMGDAMLPEEFMDPDLEQKRQEQTLTDLTTFGNVTSVSIWHCSDSRESFLALLLKHSSLQRIQTLTFHTTNWSQPAVFQQMCALKLLRKLILGNRLRNLKSPQFKFDSNEMKRCESLRTIWIDIVGEHDDLTRWRCLKYVPNLRTLQFHKGFALDQYQWKLPQNFSTLSVELGLHRLFSLNLGFPVVGLSVKQWIEFLSPLTSLRRLQCEGTEPFTLIQAMDELVGPGLSKLTVLQWRVMEPSDDLRKSPTFLPDLIRTWEANLATIEGCLFRLSQRLPSLRIILILCSDNWPWSMLELPGLFKQVADRFFVLPCVTVHLEDGDYYREEPELEDDT